MHTFSRLAILAAISPFFLSSQGPPTRATLTLVGDLPGGYKASQINGMDFKGHYFAGSSYSKNGPQGFRWVPGTGMVALPGTSSIITDVSGDGRIVVGTSTSAGKSQATAWQADNQLQILGTLQDFPLQSIAAAASEDGSVIVGTSVGDNGTMAFRWTASGMRALGKLPGIFEAQSRAAGVSADGSVVVGDTMGKNGYEAFRWTEATGMVGLGHLKNGDSGARAYGSFAYAVSADGKTIVGKAYTMKGPQAFRWTAETGMVGLGWLPKAKRHLDSEALSVSGDGSVVVGIAEGEFGTEAFIWDAKNGIRSLREAIIPLGITLDTKSYLWNGVKTSKNGKTIAGWGMLEGFQQGYILRLE